MSKFLLTDWEINGHDDSDFMCSYYDDVANVIGFHEYGTTRFAAPTNIGINADGTTSVTVGGETLLMPNADVVEKARQVLEDRILALMVAADKRLVDEPDVSDLREGLRVRLTDKAKMQVRASEPCRKCNGTGKWVNPRNTNDKRDCFTCKGSGQHVGAKVKGDDGKQVWEVIPAGTSGIVVEHRSFGTFYANGYNHPNRHNTTVSLRTDGGKVVRAGLSKLRLDRDYESVDAMRERAKRASFNYSFSALYPRHAWDTYNHAAKVAKASCSSGQSS